MAKLLLVEDDNNLREIYEARLQAEGYTIVSAKDGEEALVVAKAEKPDLVISDVMMPKISGFEMLDILRNTDELKGVKVIMLTALGQSDDQQRADKLGADRYLVKSQVTLEDIVKVTHELLEGDAAAPAAAAPAADTPAADTPAPVADTPAPAADDTAKPDTPAAEPAAAAPEPAAPAPAPEPAAEEPKAEPAAEPEPEPEPAPEVPEADASATKEAAKPAAEEEADVEAKIEDFVAGASSEPTTPGGDDTPAAVAAEPAVEPAAEPIAEAVAEPAAEPAKEEAAAPTPADDTPAKPAPEPKDSATSASDDKLMADAVEELVASTGGDTDVVEAPPAGAAGTTVKPTSIPVSIAPDDDAAKDAKADEPAAKEEEKPEDSSSGPVHKKVIKPLENAEVKKDIKQLLAEEDAKVSQTIPGATITGGTANADDAEDRPAGQPAAKPVEAAPKEATGGVDPNSIAL